MVTTGGLRSRIFVAGTHPTMILFMVITGGVITDKIYLVNDGQSYQQSERRAMVVQNGCNGSEWLRGTVFTDYNQRL